MDFVMKDEKIFIFCGVLFVLIAELFMLLVIFTPKALALEDMIYYEEQTVYCDPISVDNLILQYQEKFLEKGFNEFNLEYLTKSDNTYYIGLFQDLILFITPLEEIDNSNSEIVFQTGIIMDRESNNLELGLKYYEALVEVNNPMILEIEDMIYELEQDKTIDNNNGLLLAKIENEYEVNYVIERKIIEY